MNKGLCGAPTGKPVVLIRSIYGEERKLAEAHPPTLKYTLRSFSIGGLRRETRKRLHPRACPWISACGEIKSAKAGRKLAFLLFCSVSAVFAGDNAYRFSQERPLAYEFKIDGKIAYQNGGVSQNFNVETRGILNFETTEIKEGIHTVKLTPVKTFVRLNEMVMEDMTGEETAVSQLISTSVMEVRDNGEIISSSEVIPGIVNLSQILRLIPVFPEKLHQGKRWEQTLSSFSLPGVPMCNLEFKYLYAGETDNIDRIKLVSNQPIKEKNAEGDMTVNFTGRNSSNGEFAFDKGRGEIKSFRGRFGLLLNIVFAVPPGPEKGVSTKQSVPLNADINLNISLSRKEP